MVFLKIRITWCTLDTRFILPRCHASTQGIDARIESAYQWTRRPSIAT